MVEKVDLPARPYDPSADPRPECFHFRPGIYTCLRRDGVQYMTDLYDEWWTQREAVTEALARGGEVLVTGLGLGLVVDAMLREPGSTVSRVTVVEQSPDVVALVGPHLKQRHPGKVEIVHADAFEWQPPVGNRFSVGWHDIWPDPHGDVVREEVARLEARFDSWCDWQGSWPTAYREALSGRRTGRD